MGHLPPGACRHPQANPQRCLGAAPPQSDGEQAIEQSRDAYAAAVARLSALLEERRSVYQFADLAVSLEGSGPDADIGAPAMEVCYRVLAAINQRVKTDAGEQGLSRRGGGRLAGGSRKWQPASERAA